jgi:hypothetical protein
MNAIEKIKADYTLRLLEVIKGKFENRRATFGPHGTYQTTRVAHQDWWEPHLAARALSYIHTGVEPPDTVSSFFGEGDGAELYLRIIKELLIGKTTPVSRPMTDDELVGRYTIRNGPCEWPSTDEELQAVSAWEASIPDGARSPMYFCTWSIKRDGRLNVETLGPLTEVWDGERLHGSMLRLLTDRLIALDLEALAIGEPAPAPAQESIKDRNARWLAILYKEASSKPKGAQRRTCEKIAQEEGVKPDTVKAALQTEKKKNGKHPGVANSVWKLSWTKNT